MDLSFQADADLNHHIVLAVIRREPAIDFHSATDAKLAALADRDVLRQTARDNRILVSHDRKTMPEHFYRFITDNTSPGVIIIPQHLPTNSAVDDLILIWHATKPEEWINNLLCLPL